MRTSNNSWSITHFNKKWRITILSIILCLNLTTDIKAQCDTYVQMVAGPEGCVLPRIVSTLEFLYPCSEPSGFSDLEEGDFAYVGYIESGCGSFCQFGMEVDITCFSLPVGIGDQGQDLAIKIFPTLVHSAVYIEGKDIVLIELYGENGTQKLKSKQPDVCIDLSEHAPGIYFIRVVSKNQILVKKIVKL